MEELKNIIANNIVALRKQNNMTQEELAEKLNYSDNTISRWEHAEITPSVESLVQIAEVFDVSVEDLLKTNVVEKIEEESKVNLLKWIATVLLSVTFVWFVAAIIYFYVQTFLKIDAWMVFVWAVPLSFLLVLGIVLKWHNKIFSFCFESAILWSIITGFYLQFLSYNIYLIFIVGVPVQTALAIRTFLKKR